MTIIKGALLDDAKKASKYRTYIIAHENTPNAGIYDYVCNASYSLTQAFADIETDIATKGYLSGCDIKIMSTPFGSYEIVDGLTITKKCDIAFAKGANINYTGVPVINLNNSVSLYGFDNHSFTILVNADDCKVKECSVETIKVSENVSGTEVTNCLVDGEDGGIKIYRTSSNGYYFGNRDYRHATHAIYYDDTVAPNFVSKIMNNNYVETAKNTLLNNVPRTSDSAGIPGQVSYDANYFYVCVATDTWIRFAKTAW